MKKAALLAAFVGLSLGLFGGTATASNYGAVDCAFGAVDANVGGPDGVTIHVCLIDQHGNVSSDPVKVEVGGTPLAFDVPAEAGIMNIKVPFEGLAPGVYPLKVTGIAADGTPRVFETQVTVLPADHPLVATMKQGVPTFAPVGGAVTQVATDVPTTEVLSSSLQKPAVADQATSAGLRVAGLGLLGLLGLAALGALGYTTIARVR